MQFVVDEETFDKIEQYRGHETRSHFLNRVLEKTLKMYFFSQDMKKAEEELEKPDAFHVIPNHCAHEGMVTTDPTQPGFTGTQTSIEKWCPACGYREVDGKDATGNIRYVMARK